MKAMILAAGLGTRLKPLTDHTPKALVPVGGVPLLERLINRLSHYGYHDFIINVHHFGEQIMDYVSSRDSFGQRIVFSDERDQLLDTGGGLWKAAGFFDDPSPFLVHNVDIVSDLDLNALLQAHREQKALATLAVRRRSTSRYFLFDRNHLLKGWINHKTGETKPAGTDLSGLEEIAFSGVQIVNPEIFRHNAPTGAFSLTDLYLDLCASQRLYGFEHNSGFWSDVGKPAELAATEEWLNKQPIK